jgi:hypothetical protein
MHTTKMVLWRRSLRNIQQRRSRMPLGLLNVKYLLESEIIILASTLNRRQSVHLGSFWNRGEHYTCNNMMFFVRAWFSYRASALRWSVLCHSPQVGPACFWECTNDGFVTGHASLDTVHTVRIGILTMYNKMKACVNMTKRMDKYKFRNSPPYPANECKGQKKKGNDGNFYMSEKTASGAYRWKVMASSKTRKTGKLSKVDLQKMADKYSVARSGTKKEIAQRIASLRGDKVKKMDMRELQAVITRD